MHRTRHSGRCASERQAGGRRPYFAVSSPHDRSLVGAALGGSGEQLDGSNSFVLGPFWLRLEHGLVPYSESLCEVM